MNAGCDLSLINSPLLITVCGDLTCFRVSFPICFEGSDSNFNIGSKKKEHTCISKTIVYTVIAALHIYSINILTLKWFLPVGACLVKYM